MTKMELARMTGISRTTLDKWIADESLTDPTHSTDQKEHDA